MDERDGCPCQQSVSHALIKGPPGVNCKHRHPAEEEEHHDDQQHADDPLLGHQVCCGAVAADAAQLGLGVAGSDGQGLVLFWGL